MADRGIALALGVAGLCTVISGLWALQIEGRANASARQVLMEQPLLGKPWLNLAAGEFQTEGVLTQKAERFLEFSIRSAPHEGDLMFERSLLGVAAWPQLSTALKERVAYDLSAVLSYMPDQRPLQVALLVSAMGASDRGELKAWLIRRHVAEARLASFGF